MERCACQEVIERVGLKPAARYLMFYCADPMNVGDPESKYYESIGMDEALHPQTILAYDCLLYTSPSPRD